MLGMKELPYTDQNVCAARQEEASKLSAGSIIVVYTPKICHVRSHQYVAG